MLTSFSFPRAPIFYFSFSPYRLRRPRYAPTSAFSLLRDMTSDHRPRHPRAVTGTDISSVLFPICIRYRLPCAKLPSTLYINRISSISGRPVSYFAARRFVIAATSLSDIIPPTLIRRKYRASKCALPFDSPPKTRIHHRQSSPTSVTTTTTIRLPNSAPDDQLSSGKQFQRQPITNSIRVSISIDTMHNVLLSRSSSLSLNEYLIELKEDWRGRYLPRIDYVASEDL